MTETRSAVESDEYVSVFYATDAPRKRDFLKVLLGRYEPTVRRVERLTLAGMDREMKRVWSPEAMNASFFTDNPLLP